VPFDFPLGIPFPHGCSLVMQLLSPAQANLKFNQSFFTEKDPQRNDRISLLLYLIFQLFQFFFGKEQFAVMNRQMVIGRTEAVFGYVHAFDPKFSLMEKAETVGETQLSFPDGFHFSTGQYHSSHIFVLNMIVMVGRSVSYFRILGDVSGFTGEVF
jgi:hypothetical protein